MCLVILRQTATELCASVPAASVFRMSPNRWSILKTVCLDVGWPIHQILPEYQYRPCLKPHRIWRQYLLPIGSYSEKLLKIPLSTAVGGISREQFKLGSQHFTHLSRIFGLTKVLEWRHYLLPVGYKMLLNTTQSTQNGSGRSKTGIVPPMFNQSLQQHPCPHILEPYRISGCFR